MNPVIKLFLVLIIGIEISLIPSLILNLALILFSAGYFLTKSVNWKIWLYLFLAPLIPAVGSLLTQTMYGQAGFAFGLIMFTRIYAYVMIGADLVVSTSALQLTGALEQNCHVPAKFAFGILGALNLIPQIRDQVRTIKLAANLRGLRLTWFSPTLYFKAILAAIHWADQLSEAMLAHGFVENGPRTHYYRFPIRTRDWLTAAGFLIITQAVAFL